MELFKEMNSEKGLTSHLDESAFASYFHQGISMESTPRDWKNEPKQLSVFYTDRKGGDILSGSSYYSEADICFLDIDLWLQSVVLNSVNVEQSLADFSVSWWHFNAL